MPLKTVIYRKIYTSNLIFSDPLLDHFDKKGQETRKTIQYILSPWIKIIMFQLYEHEKSFILFNASLCKEMMKRKDENGLLFLTQDMLETFIQIISLSDFLHWMESMTMVLQSSAMIAELLQYQIQHDRYGLIFYVSDIFLYYVIDFIYDLEEIHLYDYITLCYRSCKLCGLYSMHVLLSCSICNLEYCSTECFEKDRNKHIRCLVKREKGCEMCGIKVNLKRCMGCKKVIYCSKYCQRKDWQRHKNECASFFLNNK